MNLQNINLVSKKRRNMVQNQNRFFKLIVKLIVPTNELINWQAYCENNSTNELKSCSWQHSGTPHSTSEIQPMVVLFDHHRGGIRGANSGLPAVYTEWNREILIRFWNLDKDIFFLHFIFIFRVKLWNLNPQWIFFIKKICLVNSFISICKWQ